VTKQLPVLQLERLKMSHQHESEAQIPRLDVAHHSGIDSGIDAGSSSEFDQENSAHYAIEAQDDTSEASTDEG
jgi:hypothetical protein